MAFAADWCRPARQMTGTSFYYTHTDQWRYERLRADELASPLGPGLLAGRSFIDCLAQASRLGWTPSHPAFDRNPLDLFDESERSGLTVQDHIVRELRAGRLRFAAEDPDDPANWPRVLTVWRSNLLGSSGKGMEYFMRHLLGADDAARARESPPDLRPAEVTWREQAPRGKLDLLTTIDRRRRPAAPGRVTTEQIVTGVSPYKLASVLLQYPTTALFDGLGALAEAASAVPRASRAPFGIFIDWLSRTPPDTVARHYVETFDLRRRCGSPDVTAIASAPVGYQVHAASAWLIWAVWPFSRLVHAWSAPLWYLWRPYIVYRGRVAARPAEPGTSGRRWRKIGVPY